MPIKDRNEKKDERKRRRLVRSNSTSGSSTYTFAKKGVVPEGTYEAILNRVEESETSNRNPAVDAFYTLKKGDKKYKIQQRIAEGYYLNVFYDQLLDVGVGDGAYLDDLQDIAVTVEVDYDRNDFARITVKPPNRIVTRSSLLEGDEEEFDDEE